MSRAAVKTRSGAQKQARRDALLVERWRRLEAQEALDAVLARCEGCGLEQVACSSNAEPVPCVVCGGIMATFVEALPGHLTTLM